MKLKHILVSAFLLLTLLPTGLAALLLLQSGLDLSRESYMRNLEESVMIQNNYISQTIENNMVSDFRFVNRSSLVSALDMEQPTVGPEVLQEFQFYLGDTEDKMALCMLLDRENKPIYSIGEYASIQFVSEQLQEFSLEKQQIQEFQLSPQVYSIGITTPVFNQQEEYIGSLISIYEQSYIFKIISHYHKVANTSTQILRGNGEMVNHRQIYGEQQTTQLQNALLDRGFEEEGFMEIVEEDLQLSGYYRNIQHTPWYLAGFIDNELINSFTNQFLWPYFLIILSIIVLDILLSFYFSQKVVGPINSLIKEMERYEHNFNSDNLEVFHIKGYFETQYLQERFFSLMKTIMLVQHNFQGIYQLYQSSDMGDINTNINVLEQTIECNKDDFSDFMTNLTVPEGACIVERFTRCFCEKDQGALMRMFENMRDQHLSITQETEGYTPFLNGKWFHILVVPMYEDARLSRLFVQLRDVSNFKRQEFASIELARKDALTGLNNRTGFSQQVHGLIGENISGEHILLFLDMNYFKMVNDNFGHSVGDDLLREIAHDLLKYAGQDAICSRFGGDEFAVFLPNSSPKQGEVLMETLTKSLVYPYSTEKGSFQVSVSVGMAIWDNQNTFSLEKLIQQADSGMYQAKRTFKLEQK